MYFYAREAGYALLALERAVRDLGNHLRPNHELRLQALAALHDSLIATRDIERAAAAQKELLRCQILRLGSDHPQTVVTRASLAAVFLQKSNGGTSEKFELVYQSPRPWKGRGFRHKPH